MNRRHFIKTAAGALTLTVGGITREPLASEELFREFLSKFMREARPDDTLVDVKEYQRVFFNQTGPSTLRWGRSTAHP